MTDEHVIDYLKARAAADPRNGQNLLQIAWRFAEISADNKRLERALDTVKAGAAEEIKQMRLKLMDDQTQHRVEHCENHYDCVELGELRRQLAEAKDAIKSIADNYRVTVGDDGICGLCKYDADHGLDGYANECPGFYSSICFEWIGPEEGIS